MELCKHLEVQEFQFLRFLLSQLCALIISIFQENLMQFYSYTRRRGKNLVAAHNCRRRKLSEVDVSAILKHGL
jgi:hypothetical protein